MYKNLKGANGEKLYAVCNWMQNQHKVYNANDRIRNEISDLEKENSPDKRKAARIYRRYDEIELAMEWIDNVAPDGLTYAPYNAYRIIKDIIAAYNARY